MSKKTLKNDELYKTNLTSHIVKHKDLRVDLCEHSFSQKKAKRGKIFLSLNLALVTEKSRISLEKIRSFILTEIGLVSLSDLEEMLTEKQFLNLNKKLAKKYELDVKKD
jgi:hypothetical protein